MYTANRSERNAKSAPLADVDVLPASRVTATDLLTQGWANFTHASLSRAVESGLVYWSKPREGGIGREFPVWQFVEPVPKLIPIILAQLVNQPRGEIHAFWVTAFDELNELSPAEVLSGKPFETRQEVHVSQQRLLSLHSDARLQKVREQAALFVSGAWLAS